MASWPPCSAAKRGLILGSQGERFLPRFQPSCQMSTREGRERNKCLMLQVDKRAQKKQQGQEKSWAEGWAGQGRAISVNKAAQSGLGVLTTRWQFINPGKISPKPLMHGFHFQISH